MLQQIKHECHICTLDVCLLKVTRGQNDMTSGRVSLCAITLTRVKKKNFFIAIIPLILSQSSVHSASVKGIIALVVAKLPLSFLSGRSLVYYTSVLLHTQRCYELIKTYKQRLGPFEILRGRIVTRR